MKLIIVLLGVLLIVIGHDPRFQDLHRINLEPKKTSSPVPYPTQIHLTFTTQIRTLSAPWPQRTLLMALHKLA